MNKCPIPHCYGAVREADTSSFDLNSELFHLQVWLGARSVYRRKAQLPHWKSQAGDDSIVQSPSEDPIRCCVKEWHAHSFMGTSCGCYLFIEGVV